MTNSEKCEILRNTIYQLYSKEGRSKIYISNLLQIDRRILTYKIKEWNLPEAESIKYMKPSTKKFLNANKEFILSQLKKNETLENIASELGCTVDKLKTLFIYDKDLSGAKKEKDNRIHAIHQQRVEEQKVASGYNYEIINYPGEIWAPILGYDRYMISNYGRVKSYAARHNAYYLLTPYINQFHNKVVITIQSNNGETKTLNLARLVAHAFVPGHSEETNTVNHKDGNTLNNCFDNLEWVPKADNNLHTYRVFNKASIAKKTWKEIIYQGKYRFKTVVAFAKFIGKSETQAHRYIEEPEKYGIELIY